MYGSVYVCMYITLRVLIREVAPPNILPAEARDDVFIDSDINSLDYEISSSFDLLLSFRVVQRHVIIDEFIGE